MKILKALFHHHVFFFVTKPMIYIQIKNYLSELKLPTGGHILLLVSSFSIKRGESLKFMNYDGEHKLNKKSEEKSLKMWKDET